MKIGLGDLVQLNGTWNLSAGMVIGNSRSKKGIVVARCLDIAVAGPMGLSGRRCIVPIKDVTRIIRRGVIEKKWLRYL